MRQTLVTEFAEVHGMSVEHADALLGEVRARRLIKGSHRIQPIEEFYAIIGQAIALYRASSKSPKEWPTIEELGKSLNLDFYAMNEMIRTKAFPADVRNRIVRMLRTPKKV